MRGSVASLAPRSTLRLPNQGADTFTAYPGFEAHPYVDYSAPWFGSRKVLRGASEATDPRMRHPRYRNFFGPDRNDIHAGFRSCAVPSGA